MHYQNAKYNDNVKNILKKDKTKYKNCILTYLTLSSYIKYTTDEDKKLRLNYLKCDKNHYKRFDETLKNDLLIDAISVRVILTNLFCFCEKLFIDMNAWMIGKTMIKHH